MLRQLITCAGSGQALAEADPAASAAQAQAGGGATARLWVDATRRFQTLLGFGGAFTEAAAVNWLALDEPAREAFLRAYFDPEHGHGYTLCRSHINSCDFALGHYAHAEADGDLALASFSIERDRQGLLRMIQAAQRVAGGTIRLLASPWSPPAWMKTNRRMAHGGELRPECAAAWAQCFVRFIRAYEAEGVPIWAVSVQNEPDATQVWDSCRYSPEQERDFIRDHLGPALQASGLGHVHIVGWDHNRDAMVERASVLYGDPQAARHLWGLGFHWYGSPSFEHVQRVHDAWPDKHLLFTEGCQEGGPHLGQWEVGERYARHILQDLNHWTEGWIDWNLLLDDSGGPNHVGNLCSAPLLRERASGALRVQPAYHVLGHFSRFIRPGAQRVLASASRDELELAAFANPDGSLAIVVFNATEQAFVLDGAADGRPLRAGCPARALTTLILS